MGIANMLSRSIALCVGLFFSSLIQASPFLYSFSGNIFVVNSSTNSNPDAPTSVDINGIPTYTIDGTNFTIGETLTYEFIVDLAEPGFCDSLTTIPSSQCNHSVDGLGKIIDDRYFESELSFANKSVGYDWYGADLHFGLRLSDNNDNVIESQLHGGSSIVVQTGPTTVLKDLEDWDSVIFPLDLNPVTGLIGRDTWTYLDSSNDLFQGQILTVLNLDSVTALEVPEPATLTLLMPALLMLRKFKNPRYSANT